ELAINSKAEHERCYISVYVGFVLKLFSMSEKCLQLCEVKSKITTRDRILNILSILNIAYVKMNHHTLHFSFYPIFSVGPSNLLVVGILKTSSGLCCLTYWLNILILKLFHLAIIMFACVQIWISSLNYDISKPKIVLMGLYFIVSEKN
ncbi:hypothetical protein L9F63_019017, partial [Diploptera punctata]